MKLWWVALLALVAATGVDAAAGDLSTAAAKLERAYVPALALTNQRGKEPQTREAMRRLEVAWSQFRSQAADHAVRDAQLRAVINASDQKVKRASAQVEVGDVAQAHESLEYLRRAFWKWRAARGVEYFPDRLTAYHDAMEHLVETVAQGRADARTTYAQARSLWTNVERAPFDPALHGLDPSASERFTKAIASERAALDDFVVAMATPDKKAREDSGRVLKQRFAQLYFLFGDFRGLD